MAITTMSSRSVNPPKALLLSLQIAVRCAFRSQHWKILALSSTLMMITSQKVALRLLTRRRRGSLPCHLKWIQMHPHPRSGLTRPQPVDGPYTSPSIIARNWFFRANIAFRSPLSLLFNSREIIYSQNRLWVRLQFVFMIFKVLATLQSCRFPTF